jgi:hypothetical protein
MSTGISLFGFSAATDALESFAEQMEDDTAFVGTTAEYAIYVEFGTRKMQAQPFLRPALSEGLRPNVINEVLSGVLSGDIDNKALQIALEVEKLATENAPVDTGNLQGSVKAGSTETEVRSKSESSQ